ncbi:MAG TPA: guanylate kinase [Vicinamibacteria bacterium]
MSERVPSVIVVSAPSGAGKSTVLSRVLREVEGLRFSVSHTTRKPRPGESDGVEYHFVERSAFEDLREQGALLEWAVVHGELYGTSWFEYERAQQEGVDLLLDVDVQGAAKVRARMPDAVGVFVLPPSFAALEERLRGRGPASEENIRRRLRAATDEVGHHGEYDYLVVNEDLEACVSTVVAVVKAARARVSRMAGVAARVLETFPVRKET